MHVERNIPKGTYILREVNYQAVSEEKDLSDLNQILGMVSRTIKSKDKQIIVILYAPLHIVTPNLNYSIY